MPTSPPFAHQSAGIVALRPGRAKPVRQRHPWVFSGAIQTVRGDPPGGALVDVEDDSGTWLARGYYNPHSQIVVRLLSWDADEQLDDTFWRTRLARSIAARRPGGLSAAAGASAARLVNAESDGLPGLVVDRYDRWLVVQALTLGIAVRLDALVPQLVSLTGDTFALAGVYERSDADARGKEGLPPATGSLWGAAPPERIEITEPGPNQTLARFGVDVRRGHKTGFYLDQGANRRRVGAACREREVLDVFSYTGGFGVHAGLAGARHVTQLDASAPALAAARDNMGRNGATTDASDFMVGDAFQLLRDLRAAGRTFDAVILDPPKLAQRSADIDRAARGYKDLNLSALRLLRPDGLLVTFSCSGLVSADLFQKIVFGAAVDARREAAIVGRLTQAPDHPVGLTFPEGEYLKGLLCRVW